MTKKKNSWNPNNVKFTWKPDSSLTETTEEFLNLFRCHVVNILLIARRHFQYYCSLLNNDSTKTNFLHAVFSILKSQRMDGRRIVSFKWIKTCESPCKFMTLRRLVNDGVFYSLFGEFDNNRMTATSDRLKIFTWLYNCSRLEYKW